MFIPLGHKQAWLNPQNKSRFHPQEKVLCTAGSNYVIVKQNGDVFRCFNDLSPISNINRFPEGLNQKAEPCQVGYICDSSGDQMFTSQWKDGAPICQYKNNPVAVNWKDTNPDTLQKDSICLIVTPTGACNFRCAYCCNYYPVNNELRPIFHDEISVDQWMAFMEKVQSLYANVQIQFIGGEPLMYPGIDQLIGHADNLDFDISLVSNMSSESQLSKIAGLSLKHKISISGTLHPLNTTFDLSVPMEYLLHFKKKGHKVRASIVGHPGNIPFYQQFKLVFEAIGIPLWLKGCGGYDLEYTPEQRRVLKEAGSHLSTPEYLESIGWVKTTNLNVLKGKYRKSCSGGSKHFAVQSNGEVYRCDSHFLDSSKILGNIQDVKFQERIVQSKDTELPCEGANCLLECDGYHTKQVVDLGYGTFEHTGNAIKSKGLEGKDYCILQSCLTSSCNNSCSYCCAEQIMKTYRGKDMPAEAWMEVAKFFTQAFPYGNNAILGGEPLLHPACLDYTSLFLESGWNIDLYTNLTVNVAGLCERLAKAERLMVIVSPHPTQKSFNQTSFLESIRKLNSAEIPFAITYVQTQANINYDEKHGLLESIENPRWVNKARNIMG